MTEPSGSDPKSYRLLHHYRLLTCLGVGGMGEVWAARDLAAPGARIVAVKLTRQVGVEAAKVLWDEARIASLVQHPNVCSVHEMGEADGTQYLVMDWCDGGSLHDLLQTAPGHVLPLPIAAKIGAQVAAGLHAAHDLVDESGQAMGVVHRDVSPQNVLIGSQGRVLITDFGVAKASGQTHRPTETGEVKGKLSYMAPEQVKSKDVDRRADVFALGCLLYMATLGRRPFQGEDALATLYQIIEKDVEPPTKLDRSYPPALEAILLKALAKEREERFQTAEELQVALERWLVETGTRVTEQDIASVLAQHLGPAIRKRKALIEKCDRAAANLSASPGTAGQSSPQQARGERRSSNPSITLVPGGGRSDPRRVPRWLSSLSAALGVAAAVALVVLVLEQNGVPPAADVAAPLSSQVVPAEEAKTSPPEAPVNIRISVQPASAKILLDGAVVGVGRYEADLPRNVASRVLEAQLEGYRAVTRRVVFDRAQEVHLELLPVSPDAPATTTIGNKAPVAPAPHPAPARTTTPSPAPLPKHKQPRPIDVTNPFESSG